MTRILVTGGRTFSDEKRLREVLGHLHATHGVDTVIHGACKGADLLADLWARERHLAVLAFPANWSLYGKLAGPRRNREMLQRGQPDLVVAFPGGDGTRNMMEQALAAGVQVVRVEG